MRAEGRGGVQRAVWRKGERERRRARARRAWSVAIDGIQTQSSGEETSGEVRGEGEAGEEGEGRARGEVLAGV